MRIFFVRSIGDYGYDDTFALIKAETPRKALLEFLRASGDSETTDEDLNGAYFRESYDMIEVEGITLEVDALRLCSVEELKPFSELS